MTWWSWVEPASARMGAAERADPGTATTTLSPGAPAAAEGIAAFLDREARLETEPGDYVFVPPFAPAWCRWGVRRSSG
jgi:hypothetical protein